MGGKAGSPICGEREAFKPGGKLNRAALQAALLFLYHPWLPPLFLLPVSAYNENQEGYRAGHGRRGKGTASGFPEEKAK